MSQKYKVDVASTITLSDDRIYDRTIKFCLNDICWELVGDSNPSKYDLCDLRMQKLQGFVVLLFDDPKSTWMCDVEEVDILLKFDVYLVRKI